MSKKTTTTKTDRGEFCLALNFEQKTGAPEWIELIPAPDAEGWVYGRDGRKWRISDPAALVAEMNAANEDRAVVGDYEHATELKAKNGIEAPAAAWTREFRLTEAGAIEARVEWTEKGRASVEQREYRYVSPVFWFSRRTLEMGRVDSWALTNHQNLRNRALNREEAERDQSINDTTMNEEETKALCAELGIPGTSTASEILAKTKSLNSDLAKAKNHEATPSLEKFVPRGDYDKALNRAQAAEDQLKENEEKALNAEIDQVVDDAVKAGKITPANKDFYKATCRQKDGLESFKKFLDAQPVIGDPVKLPKVPGDSDKALNAEEKAVCEQMGISIEDYQKARKEAEAAG